MKRFNQESKADITELLMGHKVLKVGAHRLLLDDGTVLVVVGNGGGCSCGAGDYDLVELNGVDNIITRVEFVDDPKGDGFGPDVGVYEIFVYADDVKVNLARFVGTDGNGYYGTGYSILVTKED